MLTLFENSSDTTDYYQQTAILQSKIFYWQQLRDNDQHLVYNFFIFERAPCTFFRTNLPRETRVIPEKLKNKTCHTRKNRSYRSFSSFIVNQPQKRIFFILSIHLIFSYSLVFLLSVFSYVRDYYRRAVG